MISQDVAIYGCGGLGRGIAWLAQTCGTHVVCFIDDDEATQGKCINTIPTVTLAEARRKFPDARVALAVNDPSTREMLASKAEGAGFGLATLVHPRVELSPWIQFGEGSIVREGCCFSVNIVLGRHVLLNMDCTIGHDVVVRDFVSLAPGVHVSGCVRLGRRVYIGTGAVIINGTQNEVLDIGDDTMIGAGACVTKSVLPGMTVVGVPARPIIRARAKVRLSSHSRRELDLVRRPSREEFLESTHVS
jgi:sugar O-acyltransferase (sialic acid O-acetyltransferase NeuD family)